MESGDGLIVRVRPVLARLTAAQVLGLCEAARAHGSGIIDLTSRANLQLRGVRAGAHEALLEALWALGLLDADPGVEGRRNVLVAPLWVPGDATERRGAGVDRASGGVAGLAREVRVRGGLRRGAPAGRGLGRYPGGARGVGRADRAGRWLCCRAGRSRRPGRWTG